MRKTSRFSQQPFHSGFSLTEVLIVLALIGILATMAIPKVLQSSSNDANRAKLRQTVSTLEQSYYDLRNKNKVVLGASLFDSVVTNLNFEKARAYGHADSKWSPNACASAFCPGELYESVNAATHPCKDMDGLDMGAKITVSNSYILFPNEVVVMGLYQDRAEAQIDGLPYDDPAHNALDNHMLCIDVNGPTGPNTYGNDVFTGEFNAWGAFDNNPKNNGKAFNWGASTNPRLHDSNGSEVIFNSGFFVGSALNLD